MSILTDFLYKYSQLQYSSSYILENKKIVSMEYWETDYTDRGQLKIDATYNEADNCYLVNILNNIVKWKNCLNAVLFYFLILKYDKLCFL